MACDKHFSKHYLQKSVAIHVLHSTDVNLTKRVAHIRNLFWRDVFYFQIMHELGNQKVSQSKNS